MLGVAHDARAEEIRARYRALARELHPDRAAGGVDPAAVREMAAVNEAWAVVGDPQRRARYDASLAAGSGGRTIPMDASAQPRSPERPPPHYAEAPGCLGVFAGVAPWVAVLAVLGAIFVFTAYAGGDGRDTTTPTDPPMVEIRDVRGSCIQAAAGVVMVVDCFTPGHEGVIVAQASLGASCPDGTDPWMVRQERMLACTEPGTEASE